MKLFSSGKRVLDLGAAPGSWSLFVGDRVGPNGRVLGIDLAEIRVGAPPHVQFAQMDVNTVTAESLGGRGSFDVVISDMAPKTTGQRHRDQFVSYELYMRALAIAEEVLAPGGSFVGKIFQGPEIEDARKATQKVFEQVRTIKPEASRSESYEIFLVGLKRRALAP